MLNAKVAVVNILAGKTIAMTTASTAHDTYLIRIVDDNVSLLESLSFMLRCEGYEVAIFNSAEAFLREDIPSRPGCVVLDVQMPGLSGIELFNLLKTRGYNVPIIFLTAHADVDMAVSAMRDGACDFYQKPVDPERFLPAVAKSLEKCYGHLGNRSLMSDVERFRSLTEREEQIMRLVASGLGNRRIAERLNISQRTVEHYRASAIQKLSLSDVSAIAAFFERIDEWLKTSAQTY